MTYSSRIKAIQDYLRKNEELIEDWEKGKIEINFAGSNIVIKTIEIKDKIKVDKVFLTINVDS
jgi:hypothetical protein